MALISTPARRPFPDPGARLVARAGRLASLVPLPRRVRRRRRALGFGGHGATLAVLRFPADEDENSARTCCANWRRRPHALVFYEAPHRILDAVAALAVALGPARRVVIARELTKLFETIHVCPLGEALAWLSPTANRQRGEFVLIVDAPEAAPGDDAESLRVLELLLDEGCQAETGCETGACDHRCGKECGLYEQALACEARSHPSREAQLMTISGASIPP